MGRVAFDPGEMQSLAGQLTSAAGSLLGVQGQVVGAAADAGLLPSGAGLAAQAVGAVAGLAGNQASLVNTAGQITVSVAAYENAMATSAALPVLAQIFSPAGNWKEVQSAFSWAMNEYNAVSYAAGHSTAGGMDSIATKIRTDAPWAWPAMQAAHNFLGNQVVRTVLKYVATASGATSAALGLAALVLAPIPGVDVGDVVLVPLAEALGGVNVGADLLLVAGGDKSRDTETDLGSAEIGLGTMELGRGLGAVKDISEAARVAQQAKSVSEAADLTASVSKADYAGRMNEWLRGLTPLEDDPAASGAYQSMLHDQLVAGGAAKAAQVASEEFAKARSIGTIASKMSGVSEIQDSIKALKDPAAASETNAFFGNLGKNPGQAATDAWNTASARLAGNDLKGGPIGGAALGVDSLSHVKDLADAPKSVRDLLNLDTQGAQALGQQLGPKAHQLLSWLASHPVTHNPLPGVP